MLKKILHWSPRILSIIFVAFLCLFSFDGFTVFEGWKTVLIVLIHLIVPIIVLLATIIAWKKDWVGAAAFCFFAVYYVYMVGLNRHWSWYVVISGPAMIISILYFANWLSGRKTTSEKQ